jgi:hypothetical protein
MKKSRLLGVVCICQFCSFSQAATITYSVSDLYNDPNVSFPSTANSGQYINYCFWEQSGAT